MSNDLDYIYSEAAADEKDSTAPVAPEAKENEVKEPQNPSEAEQKGDKEQEEGEPPASQAKEEKESESWTKTAVIDERRKRQELEKKIQQFEAEIAALKQPKQEEQKIERPDVLEDPEGAFEYTEKSFEDKLWKQKVSLTQDLMREKHEDYNEMEKVFMEMSKSDPALGAKARQAANPAKFAYETAKNHLEFQKLNDPDYRKTLEEEIKKKVLAELVEKQNSNFKGNKSYINLPDLTNRASTDSNVIRKEQYKGTLDEVFEA